MFYVGLLEYLTAKQNVRGVGGGGGGGGVKEEVEGKWELHVIQVETPWKSVQVSVSLE